MSDPVAVARRVVSESREREVSTAAASVAYYVLVSLVPTLALAVVLASAVGGPALEAAVFALSERYLLPSGRELVLSALRNTTGRRGTTVVGGAVLAWSSLKLFRGLDGAFSRVYGTAPGGLVDRLRDATVVAVATGGGVFVTVVAAGVVAALVGRLPVVGLVAPLALLAVLVAALFPVYYVFPDVPVSPREALPGTALAAVGWTVLGAGFGAYAAVASQGSLALYGVLGGVVLLATWLYLAASLLLVGAVVNAVLAGRLTPSGGDDRQVQQSGDRETETRMADDGREPEGAPDIEDLADRLDDVRADLDEFETDVRDRTVDRPSLEADLKRYVRRRMRRGHARGWGPYLVLLYGTAMTIAAFVLLSDVLAVVAMVVIFLSTLGLYVLFVLVGVSLNLVGSPRRLYDAVRERRE
jgi:YihY family inner membrane protein